MKADAPIASLLTITYILAGMRRYGRKVPTRQRRGPLPTERANTDAPN